MSSMLSSSMKMWSSLKIKLEKWKKSISAYVASSILFHICFLSSVEKIVIKVNQTTRIGYWLVNWN